LRTREREDGRRAGEAARGAATLDALLARADAANARVLALLSTGFVD
jgi:hypothetical protein